MESCLTPIRGKKEKLVVVEIQKEKFSVQNPHLLIMLKLVRFQWKKDSNAAVAASVGAKGNDCSRKGVQAAHEFSADSPIMLKDVVVAQDGGVGDTANNLEGDVDTSEEVNGIPKGVREDSNTENKGEPLEEEKDDEEDEFDYPGEVSIGKKLWNFLTT